MSLNNCPYCAAAQTRLCGIYHRACLGCAVRLVKSARPSKKLQEAMLDFIGRKNGFCRDAIIEALKNGA